MFFGTHQQLLIVLIFHIELNLFLIQMITANGNSFIFPYDLEVTVFSILGEKLIETGLLV